MNEFYHVESCRTERCPKYKNGTDVSLLHKRSRKIFRLMPVKTKLITHRQAASEDHAKNCDNNEEYVSSTPEVNTTLARLPVCE